MMRYSLVCAITVLAGCASGAWHPLEYDVRFAGDNVLEISVFGIDQDALPHIGHLGGTTALTLSSCTPGTPSVAAMLPVVHSLLTKIRLTQPQRTKAPTTVVRVPSYLAGLECLEIFIEELKLGMGLAVSQERTQLVMPFCEAGSSRYEHCNTSALFCPNDQCEIIDSSLLGTQVASVVKQDNGSYSLAHLSLTASSNGTVWHQLPQCISRGAAEGEIWRLVETNSSCDIVFTPCRVLLLSKNNILVQGDGLLFSADSGLYQLVRPDLSIVDLVSVAVSSVGRMFAMITAQNVSMSFWFGYIDSHILHQLDSSIVLQGIQQYDRAVELSSLLFDNMGNLYFVINGTKLPLRVPLHLRISSTHMDTVTAAPLSPQFAHNSTSHTPLCLYERVVIEAPMCGEITRTTYHMDTTLRSTDVLSPELNCSVAAAELPTQIFLQKGDMYAFSVKIKIQVNFNDITNWSYSARVSDPDLIQVIITPSYSANSHTTTYSIEMRERGQLTDQWEPGTVAASIDVSMKMWGAETSCLDLHTVTPVTPDYIQTTLQVGCPPGLMLTFDAEATQSQFAQYCESTDNVSCYYFGHDFRPVFKLVDSVTNKETVYTGPYTLRAVSGGLSIEDMTEFRPDQHVERSIWTPVNSTKKDPIPVFYHEDNGIKWVCGTSSPCGEIIPRNSQPTEYFFVLEASNLLVAKDSTYCHLQATFPVRIYGQGMGAVTTVIVLVVFWLILVLVVIVAFVVCWKNKLKFMYWKDRFMEWWDRTRQGMRDIVCRKHKQNRKKEVVNM